MLHEDVVHELDVVDVVDAVVVAVALAAVAILFRGAFMCWPHNYTHSVVLFIGVAWASSL